MSTPTSRLRDLRVIEPGEHADKNRIIVLESEIRTGQIGPVLAEAGLTGLPLVIYDNRQKRDYVPSQSHVGLYCGESVFDYASREIKLDLRSIGFEPVVTMPPLKQESYKVKLLSVGGFLISR